MPRSAAPSTHEPTVFVVDDDAAVRDSLAELIESVGLHLEAYDSAQAFLAAYDPLRPGCLVLDVRMPGMSGLDLQEELNRRQVLLPIIFITGHGDVPMAVQALKRGAAEFIQKPFRDQDLLERIEGALERDAGHRKAWTAREFIVQRLDTLTARESEVLEKVVAGAPNKVIANELGISHRTVEIHRSKVMEKMQAGTLAELVGMVVRTRR